MKGRATSKGKEKRGQETQREVKGNEKSSDLTRVTS